MAFGDLELRGLLFSYDYQHVHKRPAFWLTTFIGPPQVYAITPGMGWGFRLLNVNDRPPALNASRARATRTPRSSSSYASASACIESVSNA